MTKKIQLMMVMAAALGVALPTVWGAESAATMAGAAPAATEAQERGPRPMPADFEVLRQKTIFSREHVKPPQRATSQTPVEAAPPRPPVLIGVIKEDEAAANGQPRLRAVIEFPSSGQVAEYHIGDAVPGEFGGTIGSITLDGAELSGGASAAVRQIKIGQNLQGGAAALGMTAGRPASGGSPAGGSSPAGEAAVGGSAPAAPGGAAAESGMSMVERMRARRQQELAK